MLGGSSQRNPEVVEGCPHPSLPGRCAQTRQPGHPGARWGPGKGPSGSARQARVAQTAGGPSAPRAAATTTADAAVASAVIRFAGHAGTSAVRAAPIRLAPAALDPPQRYRAESGPVAVERGRRAIGSRPASRDTPPEPRRTVHPTRSGSPARAARCAWPQPLVARGPQAPAKHPTPPLPAYALHHERPRSRWSAAGWSGAQSTWRNWVFSGKTHTDLKEVVWRLWSRSRFPRPVVSPTQVRLATRQHLPWIALHERFEQGWAVTVLRLP